MQIHHVHVTYEDRYVLDPALGPVKRREEVIRPSTTHNITWKDESYDRGPDGTFDVPDECGQFYVTRPGWYAGPSPFPPEEETPKPPSTGVTREETLLAKAAAPKVASKEEAD
jgi:hypothetical protein